MLPKLNKVFFEEFLEIDKNSHENLEFINGEVFNQAYTSIKHQRLSR